MFLEFFDQYATGYANAKPDGVWCYEDGCVYRGLIELHRATGEPRWQDHLVRLVAPQVAADGSLRGYSTSEYNIDNILAGRALFYLAAAGDPRYMRAADLLASQLQSHPRTAAGNYWHKKIYPHQVWLDGLNMGLPFQIEYGQARGRPELVDDAVSQLLRALEITADQATGLYHHGYDDARVKAWANAVTGLSQSFWARAIGWLAMALVDTVALLPEGHAQRPAVVDRAVALAEAVLRHRTPSGLWLQVIDQPDLAGNYEETSASAMFAYFLLRSGRLLGAASPTSAFGSAALRAIESRHLRQDADGYYHLDNICEVAGLGTFRGRERDGTAEYYVTERVVSDDPKGVGPLMMAVAEHLLLEQQDAAMPHAGKVGAL